MTAKETAHKSAGWGGILLALAAFGQSYFDRDAARLQMAEAASKAEVNAVDEIAADLDEFAEALTVTSVILEEREDTIARMRERIDELERRHRIRTGPIAASRTASPFPMPEPKPQDIAKHAKREKRAPKADRIRAKTKQYLIE